jgi:hypothetical protein
MYVIFDIVSSIYVSYQQAVNGIDPTAYPSGYQLISFAAIALFFLPGLFGIYRITKKYNSTKLRIVVFHLMLIMGICSVGMIVVTAVKLIVSFA